jgi:hypothetical protein
LRQGAHVAHALETKTADAAATIGGAYRDEDCAVQVIFGFTLKPAGAGQAITGETANGCN